MTAAEPSIADPLTRMDTPWFRVCHELLYVPYHALFTLGFSLRLSGKDNMPRSGPAILVANHQSFLDPLVVGLSAGRPLVYLARKTLFKNRIFASIIRFMNAVPIDQEGISLEGLRTILDQLRRGRPVVIFPEGSRTSDGAMQALKGGIHLVIKRAGAIPIVPVGIAGAYDAWPIWRAYPVPAPLCLPNVKGTIAASLGQPFDAAPLAKMKREDALQVLFDKIHAEKERAERLRRK